MAIERNVKELFRAPPEEDNFDPTLSVDSTCLIFLKNAGFKIHFSLEQITYKQQPPCLERNVLQTDSFYEIVGNISTFHSLKSLLRKT